VSDLRTDLETLQELNRTRERAKELRELGLQSLRDIKKTEGPNLPGWIFSGNEAEVALLVKVQNHRNLSQDEKANDEAGAHSSLTNKLSKLGLDLLLPDAKEEGRDTAVPVLVAALTLQSLAARAETVFSETSMFCYYRIVRELFYASRPDWTIGAARAGRGGRTSAFITGECIRAILSFKSAVERTVEYLEHTRNLYERYSRLKEMLTGAGIKPSDKLHPLNIWANQAIERMWLDWYISTNPRKGAIAFHAAGVKNEILPLPPRQIGKVEINIQRIGIAFDELGAGLVETVANAQSQISIACEKIRKYRKRERSDIISRTESAYRTAEKVISNTLACANKVNDLCRTAPDTRRRLDALYDNFKILPAEIHKVLEPAQRYVNSVLDRELAISHLGQPCDAGELVFAATAFGAATNWRPSEKLKQASDALAKNLSGSGRFVTHRPFHADNRGYKLFPIGFEMTRNFAKLLHRTHHEFEPELANKMLETFLNYKQLKHSGWNFENSPEADKPYAWATAIAVQALDRIVRMLNDRINEIVFRHFKVIRPESPHTTLNLNEVIYPDYGFSAYYKGPEGTPKNRRSIAIRLEQMRAHVMRASLPEQYKKDGAGNKEEVFSAILYGPPGTGKTSLIEALAHSSRVPLVMLSPGDLIVQGQEQLESRARAVFDALTMLTQAVVLFDEFEPVLRRRGPRPKKDNDKNDGGMNLDELVRAVGEGSTAMLKFLVTGMLPKLVSLHDAAKKQALVYCLATNHLEEIDDAAKRGGRFDVYQPIYKPDPLSRAGTFFFRLQRTARDLKTRKEFLLSPARQLVFAKIVAATSNTNAGELSKVFKEPKLNTKGSRKHFSSDDERRSLFAYVLSRKVDSKAFADMVEAMNDKNFEELKNGFGNLDDGISDNEKAELNWLFAFERRLNAVSVIKNSRAFELKRYLDCRETK
jgi:ATPase family associated with various cellular activities (AAA)